MWNKPQLMNAVSDLLLVAAAAALLVAAVLWSARLPWFPLSDVVVTNELREVRRTEVERSLVGRLRGLAEVRGIIRALSHPAVAA